jgi:hypothetical protein
VAVGGSLGLEASGFDADERVLVELHSDPVELAVVTADGEGAVSTTVVLPGTVPAGEHTVVLTGQSSGRTAEAALVVVAATPGSTPPADDDADDAGTGDSDSDLASTGGSPLRPAALAAVLLVVGTALLVVATRRPRRH